MSISKTIEAIKEFCTKNSGDITGQTWHGNKATYFWNLGKTGPDGIANGVVRKLVGIDATGKQIWAVAGSFKIYPSGKILRFTGMPKKYQKDIEDLLITPITIPATSTETA